MKSLTRIVPFFIAILSLAMGNDTTPTQPEPANPGSAAPTSETKTLSKDSPAHPPPAAPAAEHAAPTKAAKPTAPSIASSESDEIDRLIKYTQVKADDGDFETALVAYRQLMARPLTPAQERAVLLGFARALRKKGDHTKAVAVYEKLLKDYPLDIDAPELYLELGRSMRALGAYKSAISRFYSVLNSTLKLPENGAARYRQLAKTAQFEIAETHFQAGNYQEASRYYTRLRLLDLAPVDRAKAHFKSAYSLYLANDFLNAVSMLRSFLDQNPDDENVPEARYLLAISYRRLQRPMESLVEALELLRTEKSKTAKDPKRWAHWQRKTGNQIANEFYEMGDSGNALTIYETLALLSNENVWKLPILYQIGLCHERLGQNDRAVATYQSILDSLKEGKGNDPAKTDLADLARMANWRLSQLSWQNNTQQRLQTLVPQQRAAQPPTK